MKTTRNNNNNTRMRMCGTGLRCNTSRQWLTKKVLFSAQRSSAVLFVSHVVCTFLLAFERLSPNVWETWMILTRKRLLVDIFVTRRLSKSFAFCEFVCVNFEPWFLVNSSRISSSWNEWNDCSAILYRVFSHDVTAAILVSQNNETAAMLVSQTNPLGALLFSYANAFFCSNNFA